MTAISEILISQVDGLSTRSVNKLRELGNEYLGDFSKIEFHELYDQIGFDQTKVLLKAFNCFSALQNQRFN